MDKVTEWKAKCRTYPDGVSVTVYRDAVTEMFLAVFCNSGDWSEHVPSDQSIYKVGEEVLRDKDLSALRELTKQRIGVLCGEEIALVDEGAH